ncbi:hypothetical protein HanHA300_Chr15g0559801 [Helianthus annuus]|nr:hypothetical protein HanHA300_Chr15g0559801 [Helianthus annuus]KAJ0472605.1 hypothetical protein HanHA89_Chr15g0608931 [Helianthus annuus]KAJ0648209.1 hypothetical protein HanLR1_Chr15g0570321 [Helianthus annuus]KAJ0652052.1 hypothetical protein HanOQP8_Chr15g0567771 [Helianthus annuus]
MDVLCQVEERWQGKKKKRNYWPFCHLDELFQASSVQLFWASCVSDISCSSCPYSDQRRFMKPNLICRTQI